MARSPLYQALKARNRAYDSGRISELLELADEGRVSAMADSVAAYLNANLAATLDKRDGLKDYRINPYVLIASAGLMKLSEVERFGSFLFDSKLYAGLETSFGKSVEDVLVGHYPIGSRPEERWNVPPEKEREAAQLEGLVEEGRARARVRSVWREIDKSCVMGNRCYLTSIKSGPNCINDTQVEAMKEAIATHHGEWLRATQERCPDVEELDIVVGITYGTERSTNNKENQIIAKLLEYGFREESRTQKPGVLVDIRTGKVRVYRRIGQDFWAFIGNPADPVSATFVFLEVLLALIKAVSSKLDNESLEMRVNKKIAQLASAILRLGFSPKALPSWVREDFSAQELLWFAAALSAFYDDGI